MGALSRKKIFGKETVTDEEPVATAAEAASAMAQVLADMAFLADKMKSDRLTKGVANSPDAAAANPPMDELIFVTETDELAVVGEEPDELVFEDDEEGDGVLARLRQLSEEKSAELKPARHEITVSKNQHLQVADEIDELTLMDLSSPLPDGGLSQAIPVNTHALAGAMTSPTVAAGGGIHVIDVAEAGAVADLPAKRKRDRD